MDFGAGGSAGGGGNAGGGRAGGNDRGGGNDDGGGGDGDNDGGVGNDGSGGNDGGGVRLRLKFAFFFFLFASFQRHLLKGCLSSLALFFVLCQKSVGIFVWVYFWVLCSGPLIYASIPTPVPMVLITLVT